MMLKKKSIFLIIMGLLVLSLVSMIGIFRDVNVQVSVMGVEKGYNEINVEYSKNTYVCQLTQQQESYMNHDYLHIQCTNHFLPFIMKQYEYEINELYSNEDHIETLLAQWSERGINNIEVILKKQNEDHTSTYYTITQEEKGYVGYFDSSVVYSEKEDHYAQLVNKSLNKEIAIGSVVNLHDIDSTVEAYMTELGYTCIYRHDDMK